MFPFLRRALPLGLLLAVLLWLAGGAVDRAWYDGASRLLRPHGASEASVVLIGFDEASEQAFPEPMALWHRHLGAAMEGLAQAEPRAVGLDLSLPMRSFDAVAPGGDAALVRGILRLRRTCPLVLGLTVDGAGRPRPIHGPFQAAAGEGGTAFVLWEVDPDATVRRFTEHVGGSAEALPTLAGTLARALGRPVREGWLDYRGAVPVPYISFHQVVAWQRDGNAAALRAAFQGKVVLLGSVFPFVDRHRQAVDLNGWGEETGRFAPGVLLHVQALRNLLGRGPLREVPPGLSALLAAGCLGLGWVLGGRPRAGSLVLLAALGLGAIGILVLQARGWFLGLSWPVGGLVAGFAARAGEEALSRLRERRRLRAVFGGYVSPAILSEILDGRLEPGLRGERRALCLLFSDIRGFTALSEGLEPEAVIALLNRYFQRMAEAIHAHGGTLDKFIGDGIMAFFGAPAAQENPCESAFRCARAMLASLDELNAELAAEGREPLRIGIGLHFGEAAVGHVGGASRHEYTAIGDVVNTASRVEGLTKEAGFPLLVTEPVRARLGEAAGFTPLGEQPLKGRAPMAVFGWPGR
ncbi:adenylate/guanylate cyclase domain-containing protein [Geothrix alkalitolerans]|uniref:adenylate/guanylate cyclase domain-containing protein n=1 Tax=Geothrix alkalitolerans TaxID=2922724 RepID=UPI001FAE7D48|nr:adenylate/guanylate cyclase domain-containing protein [Geothrix alkalitolerans]